MTAPRAVMPGQLIFVSRRCTQRQFLLRPDEETNNAFMYCMVEAARRYGLEILAVTAMSNHYHAILWDRCGERPGFFAHFHKMIAKVMNCRWGRWENFWATEQTCVVICDQPEDTLGKMVYTLVNPVAANLVDRVVNWPGASSFAAQIADKEVTFARPKRFFAADGTMPEQVSLRFCRPPGFGEMTQEQWANTLREAVELAELQAAQKRSRAGQRIVGRKCIRSQSFRDSPQTFVRRRGLRPRVASRNRWRRIEALERNREFVRAYALALGRWRTGDRGVRFPYGTYQLRKNCSVACLPPPRAAPTE